MAAKQILIVEDERAIREMIAFGLRRGGFDVREVEDVRAARASIADHRPDLVLVDWMLPDMSGLELTRALKRDKETQEVPVIMLTARAEEQDKVMGLEGGADDYITKPFSPRELLARINAVLRRSTPGNVDEVIDAQGLVLDAASHRVMAGDGTVQLGPTEYRLLSFFMTHPERVYSRTQLLDRVWGGNVYVEERTVDVHIRRLRKALEVFGYDRFIQTVRGSGYRFPLSGSLMPLGGFFSGTAGQALLRLAGTLLLALFVGLVFGHVRAVLVVVLAIYLFVQIMNLLRLDRWLRRRRTELPPDISGPWGEVIATVNRIYRRKQFHKARVLRLLREFRRLTAAMPDGAVLLGPSNQIIWFNRNAASWLGLRRKLDFGIRIENLVRDPQFVEYLKEQGSRASVTIHNPANGGRWLEIHLVTTAASEQKLIIVRDVTREVRIESIRRDFVANASHEMRSPLTVVSGYLDALVEETGLAAEWREPVIEMRRQAERMNGIINDLLELSKLESGSAAPGDQEVDVGGMLSQLRRGLASPEPGSHVITLQLESTLHLRGSESELHSVFSNLVTNAIKYTPTGGEVTIRWWVDTAGGHVSVRDTGIGIAAEHIPRLTERFYRVDPGRSRQMGGSGLGLAIVKHALQRHGATLAIESREGQGSTFTCHFPPDRVLDPGRLASR